MRYVVPLLGVLCEWGKCLSFEHPEAQGGQRLALEVTSTRVLHQQLLSDWLKFIKSLDLCLILLLV